MRTEKDEAASATNVVTKNSIAKKKKRKRWLPFRREKMEESKVNIIVDDQYNYTNAFSQSDIPVLSYSLVSSSDETKSSEDNATPVYSCDPRYGINELLEVELRMQNYVKELTDHTPETRQASPISNGSILPSKVENTRYVQLTNNAGVLLFDGVDEDISDDNSFQNIIAEEQKFRNDGANRMITTDFVVAPKDYDPVVTGFYKPKCGENRTFYESDEEEFPYVCQQPKVTVGIEIIFQNGSFSVLA